MTFEIVRTDVDLAHHGILGQKWGVRRYRNYDGTLTAAGKKKQQAQQKRLNRAAQNADKARIKYESYEDAYYTLEKSAKKQGPIVYGRWYTSGNAQQLRMTMRQLERKSTRSENKVKKLIDDLSNDYTLTYDIMTGGYILNHR